ncbi:hypothetical protein EU538_03545 [Candidatus Thorarchaeota archaeon]|nr:MAG: hypothetical protein EU538_03545 [Candidatus Thorarchaeota archaeon]
MREHRLPEWNLLVSTPRNREAAASSEVVYFIGDLIGDDALETNVTPVSGLLAVKTSKDPFKVVEQLKEFAKENPYQFRYAIRFTPMERCVESDIPKIVDAAEPLVKRIGPEEKFRVTVRSRYTELGTMDIIDAVAKLVSSPVDLETPDKIIWIEVVGKWTGVSIFESEDDILSIKPLIEDEE